MTTKRDINVALIGYGFVGKTFHAPLIASVPGLSLLVVSSGSEDKVKKDLPNVKVVAKAEAAIKDPEVDLVVIASPNDTHVPLAEMALNAGKHVVVDKPFTLNLDEARALALLAREKKLLLSVFQNRRWDSDFLGIRKVIDSGMIGQVKHFESHMDRFRPEVRDRWREQDLPGSGLWFDIGPHIVDQALQIFGLPDFVSGDLAILRPGASINDWAHVTLSYPGHKVILHASMLAAGGVSRFTVHGDKGSLIKQNADQQEKQLIAGVLPGSEIWGEDGDDLVVFDAHQQATHISTPRGDQSQYYLQIRDALNHGNANPVSPVQAIAVMAVLEAAVRSSDTGRVQKVELTEDEVAEFHKN
ncbi:oxidoreductase [Tatumella morbirosei]|uniref:Oxidoreductase n=1 Tax=Tatumella morbirosei TaxID=642227 RepID=A0A095VCG8_9GAMM|nr:oxidoreductase [Tatumella morbirosei]KGD72405.1 oxidoreductase [Tatumella morbirosei]